VHHEWDSMVAIPCPVGCQGGRGGCHGGRVSQGEAVVGGGCREGRALWGEGIVVGEAHCGASAAASVQEAGRENVLVGGARGRCECGCGCSCKH
jgi:hypothetical protein